MIVVTGATGKLGHHVIEALLKQVPANQIAAAVRSPEKAADLAALGIELRKADYTDPASLAAAFTGADKLLLISSSEIGEARQAQHKAVVDAAVAARVKLIAYTSILHADSSPLILAVDHKFTETYIKASGLPYVFLRNAWYLENHTENLAPALQHGAILGAAEDGRFAAASRVDYALAAAAVLTSEGHANRIYELAGDTAYTLTELAAAVSQAANKPVRYQNLPPQEFEGALTGFGLPAPVAHILADADAQAAKGELDSTSRDLQTLIGRATTPLADAIQAALPKK